MRGEEEAGAEEGDGRAATTAAPLKALVAATGAAVTKAMVGEWMGRGKKGEAEIVEEK